MARNSWTREQDIAVFHLRSEGVRIRDAAITELARVMNRSEASIWMRKCNFDSLDTSMPGVGLSKAAKLTKSIWTEYQQDPDRLLDEARDAFQGLLGRQ
ncbi:MAG: hypothetical protein OXC95_16075 [Dehalococcoidia bacterium]|nr:hypothetical protein [Dehalococcoidia bacterium]